MNLKVLIIPMVIREYVSQIKMIYAKYEKYIGNL